MNYEKIILELYSRIQVLEERVNQLTDQMEKGKELQKIEKGAGTKEICAYINQRKQHAMSQGEVFLVLKANDIQHALGIRNRIPSVCNAMRHCMVQGDEILHTSPSGNSTTLEIKYYL